jgi:hypothetical protein
MPDYRKMMYQILLIALVLSSIGIADMAYRWMNGKAYRELKKLKNPNQITINILNECEELLKPLWWHWALLVVFVCSIGGLIIDSY